MRVKDPSQFESDIIQLTQREILRRLRQEAEEIETSRELAIPPASLFGLLQRLFFILMAIVVGANIGVLSNLFAFVVVVRLLHLEI